METFVTMYSFRVSRKNLLLYEARLGNLRKTVEMVKHLTSLRIVGTLEGKNGEVCIALVFR